MKDLTVVILTCNRCDLLIETIQSVLNQNCNDFSIVVSDNSSNEETLKKIQEKFIDERFVYVKRDRQYSPFEHFNLCLSEVNTKYVILFHDDDLMKENLVESLYNNIVNKGYIAVGCNALIQNNNDKTEKEYFITRENLIIRDCSSLVKQYLLDNIVPFPAYIYDLEKIKQKKLLFKNCVGKYSDVAWLLNLLQYGTIKWLKKSLMYYRVHGNQDSQKIDFYSQIKLFNLYKKYINTHELKKMFLKKRISFLYGYESSTKKKYRNWKIYCRYSFFKYFPRVLIKQIIGFYK